MNGHSQIAGPSTKHILNPLLRNYFRYGDLEKPENWDALLKDVVDLFQVDFSIWKSELNLDMLRRMVLPGDLTALIKFIYQSESNLNGKEHVFIKENQIYNFFSYLMADFPDAKFVYQVRDSRDMALSWKRNVNVRGGVVRAAMQWKKDQQNSLKNAALLRKFQKIYTLKYEDLIERPELYIEEICNFLGLTYECEILDFYKDSLTRLNSEKVDAWSNLSKAVIKDNKNKYKEALSKREIKAIEKICYFEMCHLGYEPEHTWEDLEKVSKKELAELDDLEMVKLPYIPVAGVKKNMSAKAAFYRR